MCGSWTGRCQHLINYFPPGRGQLPDILEQEVVNSLNFRFESKWISWEENRAGGVSLCGSDHSGKERAGGKAAQNHKHGNGQNRGEGRSRQEARDRAPGLGAGKRSWQEELSMSTLLGCTVSTQPGLIQCWLAPTCSPCFCTLPQPPPASAVFSTRPWSPVYCGWPPVTWDTTKNPLTGQPTFSVYLSYKLGLCLSGPRHLLEP